MTRHEVELAIIMFPWPLVIAIEDCFVPQSAQLVIEVAGEYSEETCRVTFALAGMKASGEVNAN